MAYSLTINPGNPVPLVLKPGDALAVESSAGVVGSVSVPGEGVAQALAAGLVQFGPYTVQREIIVSLSAGSVRAEVGEGAPILTSAQVAALAPVVLDTAGGVASASANTAAIKAALATAALFGATVTLAGSGVAYYNDTHQISNNVHLFGSPGLLLRQAPGTNKAFLAPASFFASSTSVTLAWSSGDLLTVTWTGHGLTREDYFVISGVSDSQPQYNQIYRVYNVVDANTLQVRMARIPVASPTGTPVAWPVTRGFSIRNLRIDHDYANNGATTTIQQVTGIILGRAANFTVENCTVSNVCKYAFNVGAAMDYRLRNLWGYGPSGATAGSECLKHYGPVRNGTVEGLYGRMTDDGASIQPTEDAAFASYRWTFGDIIGLTIRDNCLHTSGGQAVMIVYAGPNYISDNIEIYNINGFAGSGSIFAINKNSTDTNCIFGKVTVDGVKGACGTAGNRAVYAAAGGLVTGQKLIVRNVDAASDGNNIYLGQNLACDVEIDGVTHNSAATTNAAIFGQNITTLPRLTIRRVKSSVTAASAAYLIDLLGTSKDCIIEDCIVSGATNRRLLGYSGVVGGASTVSKLSLRRNSLTTSGDRLGQLQGLAAGSTITFDGNTSDNIICLAFASGASQPIDVNINHSGNNVSGNSLGYIRADRGTGAGAITIRLRGAGVNNIANANIMVVGDGSGGNPQFEVYDSNLQIDVGATGFVKTVSGQMAFNTSSGGARGTLVANRLVTCNGTNWVQMDVPTNVF